MVFRDVAKDGTTRLTGLAGIGDDRMKYVARMQDAMIVEGASHGTGWRPSWTYLSYPSISYLAGKYGQAASYTRIAMPANGTVIQGKGGSANVTVSGGNIPNPSQGQAGFLWLDPGLDGATPTFYISGYGTEWTAPPWWIPIYEWSPVASNGGTGRWLIQVDYYRDSSAPNWSGEVWSAPGPWYTTTPGATAGQSFTINKSGWYRFIVSLTMYSQTVASINWANIYIDGVFAGRTGKWYCNTTSSHLTMPDAQFSVFLAQGTHYLAPSIGSPTMSDANDFMNFCWSPIPAY